MGNRHASVLLALVLATTAGGPAGPRAKPPYGPDADLAAEVVDKVLASAEHPGLTWASIPDVTEELKPLYAADPDRLLWFNGSVPVPAVKRTVAAVAAAADHGLDPADYDAGRLAEQWKALEGGLASAPDRALFDVGLSVAAARMLRAVYSGRVDPATMQWGYKIERKQVDPHALLREVREGKGLAATIDGLEPPLPDYVRDQRY